MSPSDRQPEEGANGSNRRFSRIRAPRGMRVGWRDNIPPPLCSNRSDEHADTSRNVYLV
jgi:hypothetical protein